MLEAGSAIPHWFHARAHNTRLNVVRTKRERETNKQTPWPLVRKRTIPTERPPLVDEI
jgi:hypothetical protein